MDSRILDPPHAQFGGSLGGMVGFPYHLSHHHVYELAGHQLQSASAVPFSIDGLLNGSCTASVGNSNPLLSSGCGMNGDNQQYKLSGKPHYAAQITSPQCWLIAGKQRLDVVISSVVNLTQACRAPFLPPTSYLSSEAENAPEHKQCEPVNRGE